MFDIAKKFLLDLVLENDEVKKFPTDFVTASMKWVRSWFLIDDASAEIVLDMPKSETTDKAKTKLVETKLPKLLENETAKTELEKLLNAAPEDYRKKVKNLLENANVDVQGSVVIGDVGQSSGDDYDEKNVVRGSTIKAGGDFRLGDQNTTQNAEKIYNIDKIDKADFS